MRYRDSRMRRFGSVGSGSWFPHRHEDPRWIRPFCHAFHVLNYTENSPAEAGERVFLAEEVGFEPTKPFGLCRFRGGCLLTTRPFFRIGGS